MNLSLGYLFVETHIARVIVAVMAEALGESFSLEELETICSCRGLRQLLSSIEGEIPVPAKVWVFFVQARATKRILMHV
jgi:hypothetical protein